MGKRGPKPGARNAGPPIKPLTDEQWDAIYKLAENPLATQNEIAQTVGIDWRKFERACQHKHGCTGKELIEKHALKGHLAYKQALFRMAMDGKHPIVTIFYGKVAEGYQDDKPKEPSKDDNKVIKALELTLGIINKISDKTKTTELNRLEKKYSKINLPSDNPQDADYTDIPATNAQPSNLIPLPVPVINNTQQNQ